MYIRTLALLLAVSFNVHAASGHNHGVGKLDVSVDVSVSPPAFFSPP